MQICTSPQADNHASTPSLLFTGQMPFLLPNKQHQSTEGTDPMVTENDASNMLMIQ